MLEKTKEKLKAVKHKLALRKKYGPHTYFEALPLRFFEHKRRSFDEQLNQKLAQAQFMTTYHLSIESDNTSINCLEKERDVTHDAIKFYHQAIKELDEKKHQVNNMQTYEHSTPEQTIRYNEVRAKIKEAREELLLHLNNASKALEKYNNRIHATSLNQGYGSKGSTSK